MTGPENILPNGRAKRRTDMERLAEKLKDILNEQDFCFEPWEIKVVEKALNRFAAYENTGLKPKEIIGLKGKMEGLEK